MVTVAVVLVALSILLQGGINFHDALDIALGIGSITAIVSSVLMGIHATRRDALAAKMDALSKEIRDVRSDTSGIRGHLDMPPFPYTT